MLDQADPSAGRLNDLNPIEVLNRYGADRRDLGRLSALDPMPPIIRY